MIHSFYQSQSYVNKHKVLLSGRPMNAPTVWFVQTIKMLRSGIKVFDLKNYLHEWKYWLLEEIGLLFKLYNFKYAYF